MKEICTIQITWNKQGSLAGNLAYHIDATPAMQVEYRALSAPLFLVNQLSVLTPPSCIQLCKNIYASLAKGNYSPQPIKDTLEEATLELKTIASSSGEELLVMMFHPKMKVFGFDAEDAVRTLVENYIKHIIKSRIEPYNFHTRASVAIIAASYLNKLNEVGSARITDEMRTLHYSFSARYWPMIGQLTEEKYRNYLEHLGMLAS